MNKYVLFAIVFLYLVIATLIANSLALNVSAIVIEGGGVASEVDSISGLFDILDAFWRIVTFQIDLPFMAILIFFYPPSFIVLFMIIDVVKDIIPLT